MIGFWDFKLTYAPPAGELGRSAAGIRSKPFTIGGVYSKM
jgi:hypothetical protein